MISSIPLSFTGTSIKALPQKATAVHFGITAPDQATRQAYQLLKKKEYPKQMVRLAIQPFLTVISVFFHTTIMGSLKGLKGLFKAPAYYRRSLMQRARFNTTNNPDIFHGQLPYRHLLFKTNPKKFKQYEQQIKYIMDNADFYESPISSRDVRRKIDDYCKQHFPDFAKKYPKPPLLMRLIFRIIRLRNKVPMDAEKWFKEVQKPSLKIRNLREKAPFSKLDIPLKPLSDNSTRYLISASIVEAFHNRPDLIKRITKQKLPLKFIQTQKGILFVGNRIAGQNIITIKAQPFVSRSTAIHETTHMLAENTKGIHQLTFPSFNKSEKRGFLKAAQGLRERFAKNDNTFKGRMRFFFTGKTTTGIRYYAFRNPWEFLATSHEAFMMNPRALMQTAEGREIYSIYKSHFKIDPMVDYARRVQLPR